MICTDCNRKFHRCDLVPNGPDDYDDCCPYCKSTELEADDDALNKALKDIALTSNPLINAGLVNQAIGKGGFNLLPAKRRNDILDGEL